MKDFWTSVQFSLNITALSHGYTYIHDPVLEQIKMSLKTIMDVIIQAIISLGGLVNLLMTTKLSYN